MNTLKTTIKIIKRYDNKNKWFKGFFGLWRGVVNYYRNYEKNKEFKLATYISWWVIVAITGKDPINEKETKK